MTLDTATLPPKDPTAPKPWYFSKSVILGVVLTLVGISTYFTDPLHTPTLTVASISEAVGGVLAIVLRVWFTASPIAGTGLADKAEVAKQDIALHAALTAAPAPAPVPAAITIADVLDFAARVKQEQAALAQLAGIAQPAPAPNTTTATTPAVISTPGTATG